MFGDPLPEPQKDFFLLFEADTPANALNTIIETALEHRKQASKEASKMLRQVLGDPSWRVPGFSDSYRAPTGRVLNKFLMAVHGSNAEGKNALLQAALHTWVHAQEDLTFQVAAFLDGKQIHHLNPALCLTDGFSHNCHLTSFEALHTEFAALHPEVSAGDAWVLLALAMRSLPLPEPLAAEDPGAIWGAWLANLPQVESLDDLPTFADYTGQLAAISAGVLGAPYTTLAEAANTLRADPERCAYYALDPAALNPLSVPPTGYAQAADLLTDLLAQMDRHEALVATPGVRTPEQVQQEVALEQTITDQLSQLDSTLSAEADPLPTPPSFAEPIFQQWADQLALLPPDHPRLTALPGLVAALEVEKQARAQRNIYMEGVVERLCAFEQDEQALLGVEDADRWEVPAVIPTPDDMAEIDAIMDLFDRFITLDKTKPATFAARREQNAQVHELRPGVTDGAARIRAFFEGEPPVDDTPPDDLAAPPPALIDDTLPDDLTEPPTALIDDTPPPDAPAAPLSRIRADYHTPEDVANALTPGHLPDWNEFLLAMIEVGDLTGAYWLARAMEADGAEPAVARKLIAAVQGARWLSMDSEVYVQDLQRIARTYEPDITKPEQSMLSVAAALRSTLIAPYSGLFGWLHTPETCNPLHDVIEAVKDFATNRVALQPHILGVISGQMQQESSLESVRRAAQNWIDTARDERNAYAPATNIWRRLAQSGGVLYDQLEIVAQHDVNRWEAVRQEMDNLKTEEQMDALIDRLDVKKRPGRDPIIGSAREQLKRDIAKSVKIANRWLNLVAYQRQTEQSGQNWQLARVRAIRESLERNLDGIHAALDNMLTPANPRRVRAAAANLRGVVLQLQEMLALPHETAPLVAWQPSPEAFDLYDAMRHRLLYLPEVVLDDSRRPTSATNPEAQDAVQIAEPLLQAYREGRTLYDAGQQWIQSGDFRFIDDIAALLENPEDEITLKDHAHREEEGRRRTLNRELVKKTTMIERAMLDGTITETERTEFVAEVGAVKPEEVRNFAAVYRRLERVERHLGEKLQERLRELREIWEDVLRPELVRQNQSEAVRARVTEIERHIETLFDGEDTRLLDERFSQLRQALAANDTEYRSFSEGAGHAADTVLEEYLDVRESIKETLHNRNLKGIIRDVETGGRVADFNYNQLAKPRRQESVNALRAWQAMRDGGTRKQDVMPTHLRTIMEFLDFTFPSATQNTAELKNGGGDWLHYEVSATASELLCRPIPNFGSQARRAYNVICVWDRPNADTLSAMLHDLNLDRRSVIVLYFGRMTRTRWEYILRIAREREMTMALLDEVLLLFLTQRGQVRSRLPDFLRCTLPFTNTMPYTPYQAGDVPNEMFFGREGIARELQREGGSTILYGGRQLGKSALLRYVKRSFHDESNEDYAWVEDIKLIGERAQPPASLWDRLLLGFKLNGLLPEDITYTTPSDIQYHIEASMKQHPRRRVLVMFDEADKFLERDAASTPAFAVVDRLRQLMVNTQYRFKVVFTGLHNVQRFQNSPNQPLAHFGRPMNIGPLEPRPAQNLVREPLEALGYRIEEATVLRILSYTNYHPGLIQIFCFELLKMLRGRAGNTFPPYAVERTDIEAVYLRPDVRDQIRERFGWTLALDRRYQAITWALIVDQMQPRDSFARPYYPEAVERLAKYWWERGFEKVNSDHFRGLLNEMCGLGILIRDSEGRYRLRSPNLVRLMGNEQEIENMLVRLSDTPLPSEAELETIHAPLDNTGTSYSPLSQAQERLINAVGDGTAMVLTSIMSGYRQLEAAVRALTPRGISESQVQLDVIPPDRYKTWSEVANAARNRRAAAGKGEHHVMLFDVAGPLGWQLGYLLEALVEAERQPTDAAYFRVIVAIKPDALLDWTIKQDSAHREALRACLGAYITCVPWTAPAVQQRLHHMELQDTPQKVEGVLAATGGWHQVLDSYLKTWKSDPSGRLLENWQYAADDPARQKLYKDLGLLIHTAILPVLQFIKQFEPDALARDITGENLAEFVRHEGAEDTHCAAIVEYLTELAIIREADGKLTLDPFVRAHLR